MDSISTWDLVRAFAVEEDLVIGAGSWVDGCTAPLERFLTAQLVRYFRPTTIVEIGTYRGTTTRLLLDNVRPEARVYTIDLPLDSKFSEVKEATDSRLIQHRVVGVDFQGHPQAGNVTQIWGDTFDEETWARIPKDVDFAFIDASHSYEAVRNDTEKLFRKLADGGVVLWHDYSEGSSYERGVGKYIRELMAIRDDIKTVVDTTLALRIPTSDLLEGMRRIPRFFPQADFAKQRSEDV